MKTRICDLKLRDVVQLFDGAFGHAVVRMKNDECITFFRPYATTADFEYTGGVIPYIGIEDVTRSSRDESTVLLLQRPETAR